jgi:hypothetical protein
MPPNACTQLLHGHLAAPITYCVTRDGSMLRVRGRVQQQHRQSKRSRKPAQQTVQLFRYKEMRMRSLVAALQNLTPMIQMVEAPVPRLPHPHPPATSHQTIILHPNLLKALIPPLLLRHQVPYQNSPCPKSIHKSWLCRSLDVLCSPASTRQSS